MMPWIIFLAVVGIVLICIEVFMPGAVMGIIGGICLVVAVILTYVDRGPAAGNIALFALAIASVIALALWIAFFPRTRMAKVMVTEKDLADSKSADSLDKLLNQDGKAITPLRPAGTAEIGGRRIDVVAESGLIDRDSPVRVIRVEGNRVKADLRWAEGC
jgi:membrane-bound serine protease (ClpP class)